jgi:hypothetical protein
MPLLSKTQIIEAKDLPHEDIEVAEWGGAVRVRALTGTARGELEGFFRQKDERNYRERLLALSIVGEDGERLFTSDEVEELARKNAEVIERIFSVAVRLSGLSKATAEEAKKN